MAHRPRPLNHGEIALWREVTKSIRPLYGQAVPAPVEVLSAEPEQASIPRPVHAAVVPASGQKAAVHASKLLPLAPIERPLLRKISRGQYEIDAVLDLHGLRQHEAHERLRRFLHQSQFNRARVVLVVTGKGNTPHKNHDEMGYDKGHDRGHDRGHGKGVLRRLVPDWLRMPDLRSVVMGFEEAASHQGGSGALYVRLRKRRGEGGEE